MLDWWGSDSIEDLHLQKMKAAGVQVRRYNPLRAAALGRMNNRTHRKLLVVDGRIGFTGGVGIADPWRGHAQDPQHWRDTHFRVEGPVVTQLQAAFLDNWITVTGQVLHGPAYLPPIEAKGPHTAQAFTSAPGGGAESVQLMYLMSIAAARSMVWLSIFDSRSFSVNDEANLNIHDAGFARDQAAIFERDLRESRRVTLTEWESRPWTDKLLDALAGLLSSQL